MNSRRHFLYSLAAVPLVFGQSEDVTKRFFDYLKQRNVPSTSYYVLGNDAIQVRVIDTEHYKHLTLSVGRLKTSPKNPKALTEEQKQALFEESEQHTQYGKEGLGNFGDGERDCLRCTEKGTYGLCGQGKDAAKARSTYEKLLNEIMAP